MKTYQELDTIEQIPVSENRAAVQSVVRAAVPADNQHVCASPAKYAKPALPGRAEHPLDRAAHLIKRFVFLKNPCLYRLLSVWAAATHIYEEFEYTGYIFAFSPEPQSGKSRLLEILDLLVANSSGVLISPSEAVLFRTAESHSQLIDEVDGLTNRDELRSVLNAGFQKGATVQRLEENDGKYQARGFPVYAPRALAGIGSQILSTATRDRTFSIEMVRQLPAERRERFRLRTMNPEIDKLRTSIATWIEQNKGAIVNCYAKSDFPYLENFRDRTIDVAQPLAAIIEVAYQDDAILNSARAELVEAIALTRNDELPVSDDHRVLEVLANLARNEDPLVGNASELSERCASALGQSAADVPITSVLRRYGYETKSIRKDGEAPRYRYSLPLAELEELLARYGGVTKTTTVPG